MMVHANGMQRKVSVDVLTSEKIDLKIKKVARDKDGQFIMIKGTFHQVNIAAIYMHQTWEYQNVYSITNRPKEETDKNTIIVGNLNIPLTAMDRSA